MMAHSSLISSAAVRMQAPPLLYRPSRRAVVPARGSPACNRMSRSVLHGLLVHPACRTVPHERILDGHGFHLPCKAFGILHRALVRHFLSVHKICV